MEFFWKEIVEKDNNSNKAIDILFDEIDFSLFTHETIEFYQEIFGHFLCVYFDAHAEKGRRKIIVDKVLYLESKIGEIPNERVRKELYKSLTLSLSKYCHGDWSKATAIYTYEDKMFLNMQFEKYGKYHIKDMIQTIYQLRIDEVLPEILLSLNVACKEAITNNKERFEKDIVWEPLVTDGTAVKKGDIILRIEASYRTLLCGERLSLNILQRMSGIATATSHYMKELAGTHTQLLDTRKTAPGLRVLDKMAVHHGGGSNHRMGLYDMIMLKDNHIKIAGGIPNAVKAVKQNLPLSIKVEVETTNLEEVQHAVEAGADIIMFDNMSNEAMAEAVKLIAGRAKTEASGNMSIPRLKGVAATGVDYISVGALTHSVTAMDISMNIKMN